MAVVAARMMTCAFIHVYAGWREGQTCGGHSGIYRELYITSAEITNQLSVLYRTIQGCIKPTTTRPLVSIQAKTTSAFTSVATRGVRTVVLTAVATLAFIDICIYDNYYILYITGTFKYTQTHTHDILTTACLLI